MLIYMNFQGANVLIIFMDYTDYFIDNYVRGLIAPIYLQIFLRFV